jgi:O-antigen ligase
MEQQSKLEKTFHWSLYALLFSIPVSSFISTRVLIVVLLISLFVGKFSFQRLIYRSWDIAIYLLVLLVGLLFTHDLDLGLRVLETSFSFLAVPLIFTRIQKLDDRLFNRLYLAFSSGLAVAGIICLSNALYRYTQSHDVGVFFFYDLTDIIHSHPTYFAYYLIFGLTVALYRLYYETPVISSTVSVCMAVFFFLVLMLTGGTTAFISLLLIVSFFILKYTLEPATTSKRIVLILVCFMMTTLFLANSAGYWYDFNLENDYWERSALWKSAIFANTNPLLGVGTGDYTEVLNQYYLDHGMTKFAASSFNAHNQFLQIYLSNGLIGLLAILILSGRPLFNALRDRFPFGVLVFFPFVIYGMNEVLLGRYQGVIFFVITHQLLITYSTSDRPVVTETRTKLTNLA